MQGLTHQPVIYVSAWNTRHQFDLLDSFTEALMVVVGPLRTYSCYASLLFVNASESELLKRYNCILMPRAEMSQ